MPFLILATIQKCVRDGSYLIKSHAVIHALKEGFDRTNIVEAVLNGSIIEDYADAQRVLVCGKTMVMTATEIYLHVVCEYADPVLRGIRDGLFQTSKNWRVHRFADENKKRNKYDQPNYSSLRRAPSSKKNGKRLCLFMRMTVFRSKCRTSMLGSVPLMAKPHSRLIQQMN